MKIRDIIESFELPVYEGGANGMFETNPTVRVQSLKNPQHLGWDEL